MGTHRRLAVVVTGALTAAATLFGASAADASSGYTTVVQWAGGKTKACRVDSDDGSSRIKVYWDGQGYRDPAPGAIQRGGGGLAHVSANFDISGWTYSFGRAGGSGPVVSRVEATQGYVYFLAGSAVGICKERVMPVTSVSPC